MHTFRETWCIVQKIASLSQCPLEGYELCAGRESIWSGIASGSCTSLAVDTGRVAALYGRRDRVDRS